MSRVGAVVLEEVDIAKGSEFDLGIDPTVVRLSGGNHEFKISFGDGASRTYTPTKLLFNQRAQYIRGSATRIFLVRDENDIKAVLKDSWRDSVVPRKSIFSTISSKPSRGICRTTIL
ncbi:hypothetical protein DACRYDRAFT_111430 [Dacryopinax primogenitus]|uniref:Fungal-type protein kinase domain-containing protein n=1 Tax=Dacryopinax primogenitus (strain DJM 731) TaxID=1858805 RepID=M5FWT9_DACPD|nr:uncharacterized protein DACRYDRAFT_111430 [Dacryopinax primogenitus]EJT97911.1 hypothetical protein DACRYDRAFT_111430 [Dacryopinax primogenitus]